MSEKHKSKIREPRKISKKDQPLNGSQPSKNEKPRKLKLMEKLQLNQDYSLLPGLFIATTIVAYIFMGPIALIGLPVCCFYMAALQLHSGIGLESIYSETNMMEDLPFFTRRRAVPKLIALYRRDRNPFRFYFNVGVCLLAGVVTSVFVAIALFALIRGN